MKKNKITILPVLLALILLALYFGVTGIAERRDAVTGEIRTGAGGGFDVAHTDETGQMTASFQRIRLLIVAIAVLMMLYSFFLLMGLRLLVKRNRMKMKSAAPTVKRAPEPVYEGRRSGRRPDVRTAVKVEGTYTGITHGNGLDVDSFLAQGRGGTKQMAGTEAPPDDLPNEVLESAESGSQEEQELAYAPDTETGNLFAGALRYATGADLAFINSGGIRSALDQDNIMETDVAAAFPFGDTVTVQGLTETQIKAVLEHSAGMLPETDGRCLYVSGIVVELDAAQAAGGRVVSVTLANGEAMRGGTEYIVAVNEYIANGGDGYDMLAALPHISEGQTVTQAVLAYIADTGNTGLRESENIKILANA